MTRETLTKIFPDLKNPNLEPKIIKIGQEMPELCTFVDFENILKKVDFADWSGKRQKLSPEAQNAFLTTSSAQNACLGVGYNMEYIKKASAQYIRCYNTICEPGRPNQKFIIFPNFTHFPIFCQS